MPAGLGGLVRPSFISLPASRLPLPGAVRGLHAMEIVSLALGGHRQGPSPRAAHQSLALPFLAVGPAERSDAGLLELCRPGGATQSLCASDSVMHLSFYKRLSTVPGTRKCSMNVACY